jgi:DNA-binding SARP family transcriptional activator
MGLTVLRARLLGPMDLRFGERQLPPLDSGRAESLLAYLLLHRDAPQPRQRLAFLLWPDSAEGQAHTNLRKVLHNLRRALPDADHLIEVGPRTLRWRPDAPLWLDVEQFERAVATGQLEEAVQLYVGELLEGRYDEWLADERGRLAGLHADALERLARQQEHDRRWPEAIRSSERLVAHDPLREESHRLLIRLCQASGDRARAVRAYHACAATLERELGIAPAAGTRAIYESLIAVPVPSTGTKAPSTSPFVGRAAEQEQLAAVWSATASGHAQLLLVTGEAGVGKTRLVDELRARAGAVTAEAQAYPAEGPLAYGLAAAWLRSAPVSARLSRLERPQLTELARLLPELAGHVPPPEPLPEAELRYRLFGAIARALLAAGAPLLLLIADDVQWADPQSLGLIHYLMRVSPSPRLLVAATARREELDEDHPLTGLTTAVAALGRFSEIELRRLDREETALLAERITGAPLDAPGLERLSSRSRWTRRHAPREPAGACSGANSTLPLRRTGFILRAAGSPPPGSAASRPEAATAGRHRSSAWPATTSSLLRSSSPTAGWYGPASTSTPTCSGASAAAAATSASSPSSSSGCTGSARSCSPGWPCSRWAGPQRSCGDGATGPTPRPMSCQPAVP